MGIVQCYSQHTIPEVTDSVYRLKGTDIPLFLGYATTAFPEKGFRGSNRKAVWDFEERNIEI